jgi:hypothetical protein
MIEMRKSPLLIISAIVVLAGCGGTHGLDTSKPVTPGDVIALVNQRNARLLGMTAYGTLSIDTPELSNTGSIEVNLLKPDTMMFEISGPFGVRVASGLITSRQFTFYNALENTVAEGLSSSDNLKNILRISINFTDALDILSGTMRISPSDSDMCVAGTLEDGYYRITYAGPERTDEFLIDLSYECVTHFTKRNAAGDILENITFKDFHKKSGLYMPGIISIERPPKQESLLLSYEQQTLNDLPIDFTFKVPKSAKKIRF